MGKKEEVEVEPELNEDQKLLIRFMDAAKTATSDKIPVEIIPVMDIPIDEDVSDEAPEWLTELHKVLPPLETADVI